MKTQEKWLSKCCSAPVKVVGGDEGTNHWECAKCGNPCDAIPSPHTEGVEELLPEEKLRDLIDVYTIIQSGVYSGQNTTDDLVEAGERIVSHFRKALHKTREEITAAVEAERNTKSIAWCECGDALETKAVMKKLDKPTDFGNGLVTEIIDHFEYYCFGCDETYLLKKDTSKHT